MGINRKDIKCCIVSCRKIYIYVCLYVYVYVYIILCEKYLPRMKHNDVTVGSTLTIRQKKISYWLEWDISVEKTVTLSRSIMYRYYNYCTEVVGISEQNIGCYLMLFPRKVKY